MRFTELTPPKHQTLLVGIQSEARLRELARRHCTCYCKRLGRIEIIPAVHQVHCIYRRKMTQPHHCAS